MTRRYYGDSTHNIAMTMINGNPPPCPANYEGDRCQTCKGCAEGLACSTTFPSSAVGECFAPADLAGAFGLNTRSIDFSKKEGVSQSEQNPWYTISQQTTNRDLPNVADHFPDLEALVCTDCKHLPPGPIYGWISQFSNLKTLVLTHAKRNGNLSSVDLKSSGKPTLTVLDLNGNNYIDAGNVGFAPGPIPKWANEFQWTRLSLDKTMRSGDMEEIQLDNSYSTMVDLELGNNWGFSPGPFPKWVGNFQKLKSLGVHLTNRNGDISMVDNVVQQSKFVKSLEKMLIDTNPFTRGPVPAWLRNYEYPSVQFRIHNTNRYGVRRKEGLSDASASGDLKDVDQDAVTRCGQATQQGQACIVDDCDEMYTGSRCQTCKKCGARNASLVEPQPGLACLPSFYSSKRFKEHLDSYLPPSKRLDLQDNYCVVPQDPRSAFGDDVTALDFSNSNLVGDIPNIPDVYPQLQSFNLNQNPLLAPGQLWRWVSEFTGLEELSLANSGRIGPMFESDTTYLDNLKGSLRTLNLGDNNFDQGSFPKWLAQFSALVVLDLQKSQRSGDLGAVDLRSSRPTLATLILNDNPAVVPGPVPAWLKVFIDKQLSGEGLFLNGLNIYGPRDTDPLACAALVLRGESCERNDLCSDDYKGARCESCKACRAENLMCGGEYENDDGNWTAFCKVPPGIGAAVGYNVINLDFSSSTLIDTVPDMSSLPKLESLDVSNNPQLTKDQDWSWAEDASVSLNLYNSNQVVSYGDACTGDGQMQCAQNALCRTHCCMPDISSNCSFCDNTGICFDELVTTAGEPAVDWHPSNVEAWQRNVVNGEMLLNQGEAMFIDAPDSRIVDSLRRDEKTPAQVKYVVRWTDDVATDGDQSDAKRDEQHRNVAIGDHPPSDLVESGSSSGADPGRFYVDHTDGSIIAAPANKGHYKMWLVASVVGTKASSSVGRGLPTELEEIVVAKWNVKVQEKGVFKVTASNDYIPKVDDDIADSIDFDKFVDDGSSYYALNEVYNFKPVNCTAADHVSGDIQDVTFTLKGEASTRVRALSLQTLTATQT